MANPITVKPVWVLSNDWKFVFEGKEIGRITWPWSRYLLGTICADLNLEGVRYNLALPTKASTYLADQSTPMELRRDDSIVATLEHVQMGTTEESLIGWDTRCITLVMSASGKFVVKEAETQVGAVEVDLMKRQRTLKFDQTVPIFIQALCFWGTIHPISTFIST